MLKLCGYLVKNHQTLLQAGKMIIIKTLLNLQLKY